jgi:hypothetical protein
VACYTDRRGAWLIWTDADALVLAVAVRADRRADELYRAWLAGLFSSRLDEAG